MKFNVGQVVKLLKSNVFLDTCCYIFRPMHRAASILTISGRGKCSDLQ